MRLVPPLRKIMTQAQLYVLSEGSSAKLIDKTSEQWLRDAERGAYTTSRTFGGNSVFDLQHHIDRLSNSANLMVADDALKSPKEAVAMRAVTEGLLTSETLRPKILESLRTACLEFKEHCGNHQGELRLTTLLTWTSDDVTVKTHAAHLPDVPNPPIKVQIKGVARTNAVAKDSEWIRQRQQLQDSMPPDVNEILLADESGAVLEGMSSNLFILSRDTIMTADEGILVGTVRNLVIKVCEEAGIPVKKQAPRLQDSSSWDGALVTSTSRLALPVDSIELPSGEVVTFDVTNPLIQSIRDKVAAAISACSERLY